ncbi:dihydrofolate reductase family protein [Kribbella solani]|uniref:Dihydrofolate reductase n=1 Tax=Kribbella solani TaxID=236067 RepID=A0A841E379_9ACTN|nr:dihydrofolate reductase family protein [Kribbella solani]MBB5983465.1 dihydrofolate reductase [Kribbella solani]
MRELTYFIAASLDGYVAADDGGDPTDVSPGGFFLSQGDHSVPLIEAYPETLPGAVRQALGLDAENRVFDTVLMGRRTWELGVELGTTNAYPRLRNLVFSRTLGASPDPTVELVGTDPVERVRELKREPGLGIWLCGGGALAESLWPEIDRLVIKVNPVVIGAGVKLFESEQTDVRTLELTDHQIYGSGIAVLTYRKP